MECRKVACMKIFEKSVLGSLGIEYLKTFLQIFISSFEILKFHQLNPEHHFCAIIYEQPSKSKLAIKVSILRILRLMSLKIVKRKTNETENFLSHPKDEF